MGGDANEFGDRVAAVLRRYFVQNGRAVPDDAALRAFAGRLWALVAERGLPRPLAVHERGEPGEMSEAECAPLVARIVDGADDPCWAEATRQLVKACLYPEFKTCRDSFREVAADGSCRRQELARVRRRVSGTHCVDCPHWVALTPEQHERFLTKHWRAGAPDLLANRDAFLPEDFRALRQWLHAAARRPLVR